MHTCDHYFSDNCFIRTLKRKLWTVAAFSIFASKKKKITTFVTTTASSNNNSLLCATLLNVSLNGKKINQLHVSQHLHQQLKM